MKTIKFFVVLIFFTQFLYSQYQRDSTTINFEVDCTFDTSWSAPLEYINTSGQRKLTIILISSPDAIGHPYLSVDQVNDFKNDLENYFLETSRNIFELTVDILVKNPNVVNGTVELFSLPNNFNPNSGHETDGFEEVLLDADKNYDFNNADFDHDGKADHIAFVIAKFSPLTPAKLYGRAGFLGGTFVTDDIANYGSTSSGNVEIDLGSIDHNYSATQGNYYDRFGILQHELTHSLFRFPDIEHGWGDNYWYAFGGFDGSTARFGDYPTYWNPYFRKQLGWLSTSEISSSQTLNLNNLETNVNTPIYVIKSPISANEEFWLIYHDYSDFANNKLLKFIPLNELDLEKGCLVYRHRKTDGTWTNRRRAPLTLESASGKWEWTSVNSSVPNYRKYRAIDAGSNYIPNITHGLDSLQVKGSYMWIDGGIWYATYEDFRIGSFTNYFTMDESQDFTMLSNPSSNLTNDYESNFALNIASEVGLKNFRIDSGTPKVDIVIGTSSYTIDKSATIKAQGLKFGSDIIITNTNVELKIAEGSDIIFENAASIFVQNGAKLTADGVTFDFDEPENRNGIYAINGGHLTLKNCTVINGEKGVRALSPGKIELEGNNIHNQFGSIELYNIGSQRAVIYNNTITIDAPYNYGIIATGTGSSSEIVISGNAINAGSGISLNLFGKAEVLRNEITGDWILGSKGLLSLNLPNLFLYKNNISHFDLGFQALSNTTAKLGFNKIYSNLWHGIESQQSIVKMTDDIESETSTLLRTAGCNECYNNGNRDSYSTQNAEIHIGAGSVIYFNKVRSNGYNTIYDTRNIPSIPNEILIYNSAPSSINDELNARISYWGGQSPEYRFWPAPPQFIVDYSYFRTSPFLLECSQSNSDYSIVNDLEGNTLDTLYYESVNTTISLTQLDSLYAFAEENAEAGDFEAALEAYRFITTTYPEEPGVIEAYHQFLNVLNQMNANLSEYNNFAETLANTAYNGDTTEIGLFLQRLYVTTNIYMGNYNVANDYLDSIIQNSQSEFEILDAEFEQALLSLLISANSQNRGGSLEEIKAWALNSMNLVSDRIQFLQQKSASVNNSTVTLSSVPTQYVLESNYPNPFNPSTKISYGLVTGGSVTLKVYDILGRTVKTLVNEKQEPGYYTVDFIGSGLASGIYFYELKVNGYQLVKKMNLLK